MKRIVRLTESDLVKLVKRVINEQQAETSVVKNPNPIKNIIDKVRGTCPSFVKDMRTFIIKNFGLGSDYTTFADSTTWGQYISMMKKIESQLMTNIGKTGQNQLAIQLINNQSPLTSGCTYEFQTGLLNLLGEKNELTTPDFVKTKGKEKYPFNDGIAGLATALAFVRSDLSVLEAQQQYPQYNPNLKFSQPQEQSSKKGSIQLPKYQKPEIEKDIKATQFTGK